MVVAVALLASACGAGATRVAVSPAATRASMSGLAAPSVPARAGPAVGPTTTASSPPTTAAPSPTPSPVATPPLGSVVVAFAGPMTGPAAATWRPELRGLQLALQRANQGAFGPLPVQVLLLPEDTQGTAAGAAAAALRIAADPWVDVVVGPPTTAEAQAMGGLLNALGIPFVSPSATGAGLAANGWGHFFQAVGTDAAEGAAAAQEIAGPLGAACAPVVADGTLFGTGFSAGAEQALPADGVQVPFTATMPSTRAGLRRLAALVRTSGCPEVAFGGQAASAARLRRALDAGGLRRVGLVGGDLLLVGRFAAAARRAGDGTVAVCACADPGGTASARVARFAGLYQAAYGRAPGFFAAEAYDVGQLLIAAIKSGKTTRTAIHDFLRTLRGFPGVTKDYTFGAGGALNPGPAGVGAYRDVKGRWVFLQQVPAGTAS